MAINIRKIYGYILDKDDTDKHDWALYGQRHNRYFRWFTPAYCLEPIWYHLNDEGEICGKPYNNKELEQLFKESNGFLEQLELF